MTAQNHSNVKHGLVLEMRNIREQISREISDMTFAEERAYLDKLLAEKANADAQEEHKPKEIEEESASEKA